LSRKSIGFLVLVLIAVAGGVVVGTLIRDRMDHRRMVEMNQRAPRTLLGLGDDLPDVTLTVAGGYTETCAELLSERGSIVLFLDLECPPCVVMCQRWQRALDDGEVDDTQVFGITNHPQDAVAAFLSENNITFPVHQDAAGEFRKQYEVDRFPLEVVVGASGRVRSLSYDSVSPVDFNDLAQRLAD